MRLLAVLVVFLIAALWFLRAGDSPESEPTNLTAASVRSIEGGEDHSFADAPIVAEQTTPLRVEIEDEVAPESSALENTPGTIEVFVLHPDGTRAVGAEVVIETAPRSGKIASIVRSSKPTRAKTDATGHCELAVFDGQLYSVLARVSGLRSARATPVALGDRVTLRLEPEAGLFGVVVSAEDQRPIGEALLLLEADGAWTRVSTAADGSFRLPSQRAISLPLEILAAGYERTRTRITPSSEPHTLELGAGQTLSGRVIRRGDGAPLADALVEAVARRKVGAERIELSLGNVRTASDGTFTLPGLPTDGFELLATTPLGRGGLEVDEAVSGAVTIEIGSGASLTGTIRSSNGKSVAGATVALVGLNSFDAATRKTKSNEAGGFSLPFVPVDQPFEIVVFAADTTPHVLQLASLPNTPLEIVLLPKNRLMGIVRDSSGQPVAGAAVELAVLDPALEDRLRASRSPAASKQTRTRPDGRFAFECLPPGEYRVRVDDRRGSSDWVNASLAPATDIEVVLLANRSVTLAGTVTSRTRLPIAGAIVRVTTSDRAAPRMCRSRDDGSFTLSALGSGNATIEADAEGFAAASSDIVLPYAIGNGEIRIELADALMVRGKVVDARSRAPIPSFSLRVEAEIDGDRSTVAKLAIEDRAGEFALDDLPEGDLALFVRAAGFFSAGPFPILATSHVPLTIELESAAEVAGQVLGPAKSAMFGVRVFVRQLDAPNAGKLTATHTKADGSFRLRDLQPGRVEIGIGDPENPALAVPARDISYGENDVGALALSNTGTIEISLRNAEAFSHHAVTLRGKTTKTKVGLDAGSSGVRAGPLLPDTYVIELTDGKKREVALTGEATVKVEFDLR